MLHHVSVQPDDIWSISIGTFRRLLFYCRRNNVQFQEFDPGEFGLNKRQLCLTFDDCSKELLDTAVPLLLDTNITATFFMPSAHMGRTNLWQKKSQLRELMSASDLRELQQHGFEIGSHGHEHVHLSQLSALEIGQSIQQSKEILEQTLGTEVNSFSYPYGDFSNAVIAEVKLCGYKKACSVHRTLGTEYTIPRRFIHEGDNQLRMFAKLL